MSNRLAGETSPYLLQHKDNPVDWYPWGAEALDRAREEDKPIFLSIGYAACHWCHVMAHESFEDPQVAALMNQNFINIKVDREERPDIDTIYMSAVVAMTGQGGWPMSLFLTPDGKPFYAGTYFPPVPRYSMPSFRQLLEGISASWKTQRGEVDKVSQEVADHLQEATRLNLAPGELDPELLEKATKTLARNYDWAHGGWGSAPKFPQPMVIEYLLAQVTRGDDAARKMAVDVLQKMAQGGMYDLVSGGFHRYSTDDLWLVPHFEKMLYDNAQLALVYLHAFLLTADPQFRQICEETLDFIRREMTHPQGGFFSSLDADSEGQEGKYYSWTYSELEALLSGSEDFRLAQAAFDMRPGGNFEGKIILRRAMNNEVIARTFGISRDQVREKISQILSTLHLRRSQRVRPGTDDKILVAWNSLALRAFAEAGRYLQRQDYIDVAMRNGRFLLDQLSHQQTLFRSWRNHRSPIPAYLEDHAALAVGLIALYQADPDPAWFQAAQNLVYQMQAHFRDPSAGFFDTRDDQDPLLVRPKDLQDNATPCGNALATHALLWLAAFTEQSEYSDQARAILGSLQEGLTQYPTAFGYWLSDLDLALGPVQQIAILGESQESEYQKFIETVNRSYRPRTVLAASITPPPPGSPFLLQDRPLQNQRATAFVCERFVCLRPVNTAGELLSQIG